MAVQYSSLVYKSYNSEEKIAREIRHFVLEVPRHIVVEKCLELRNRLAQ
jgi:hypothetical protein